MQIKQILRKVGVQYLLAIALALLTGLINSPALNQAAETISTAFVAIFKWCSIPMLSLAVLSTASGLTNQKELWFLGKNVFKYTLITTIIAAATALLLFLLFNPTNHALPMLAPAFAVNEDSSNIFGLLLIVTMFAALLLSCVILYCKPATKHLLHKHLASWFKTLMTGLQLIIKLIPLAIWAFVTIFLQDINGLVAGSILLYLTCVVLSNLTQAIVVLPLLLRKHGISPIALARQMWPAIGVAFWSKSSGVALPIALQCAVNHAKLDEKIARFSLPICTTINMNACAAFILTTVLFVSTSYGMHYSTLELIAWIGVATLAAIGNASVPMGCFTMAMALLALLNVPLSVLGLILPFYALLDMLESAINIWSDSCVTAIVAKKLSRLDSEDTLTADLLVKSVNS